MKRKLVSLFLSLSLMVVSVTGCQSDSVTEETKKEVQTKKSQVLSLYKEIETMIQKNHIEADADFAKMKDKLTSMSKKVDEKIEDTTEEDAKQAITELKRLETNEMENVIKLDVSLVAEAKCAKSWYDAK